MGWLELLSRLSPRAAQAARREKSQKFLELDPRMTQLLALPLRLRSKRALKLATPRVAMPLAATRPLVLARQPRLSARMSPRARQSVVQQSRRKIA